LGFSRNLTSAEIVEQALHIRAIADAPLANIVFMGMGEPLLNLDAVREAIAAITDTGFSRRRITISTVGIARGIEELAERGPDTRLAVSITSARPELRAKLVPAMRSAPLPALREALIGWQRAYGKRVTLEAVLLAGVNTTDADAEALAGFASGLEVMVNLIPWNSAGAVVFEGAPLRTPSGAEVRRFVSALTRLGLKVVVRRSKGTQAAAACGQLGATSQTGK
jgi:23S rRNA (adenine2503-C2)-methyltransferase